jgi:dephospho-CoA kinase
VYRVALTGNIASGKSWVARVWQRLGAHVIDADELARRAVEPGSAGLAAVRDVFGEAVIAADGSLDRARLREIVFNDDAKRVALERIVHPEVARLREREEVRLAERGVSLVVHMVPLLFEAGLEDTVDAIVFVDAPDAVRRERLVRERGLDVAEAERMIAAQQPAARKRARADWIIDNAGTLAQLERGAEVAWRYVSERAAG